MAHIPYGYRIAGGRAEILEEEAERIRNLCAFYLEGMSIAGAGKAAGIRRSASGIGKILGGAVYLGDDYYPAILSAELTERVQKERARRAEESALPKREFRFRAVPVRCSFYYEDDGEPSFDDPAAAAEQIYRSIRAS